MGQVGCISPSRGAVPTVYNEYLKSENFTTPCVKVACMVCCDGNTLLLQRLDTCCPWLGGRSYVHGLYISGFELSKFSAAGRDIPNTAATCPAAVLDHSLSHNLVLVQIE